MTSKVSFGQLRPPNPSVLVDSSRNKERKASSGCQRVFLGFCSVEHGTWHYFQCPFCHMRWLGMRVWCPANPGLAIEEIFSPCKGNTAHFHGVEATTWHYFAILRHDSLEQSDEAAVLWILWQHSQGDFERFPKCPCCGSHLQQHPIVL